MERKTLTRRELLHRSALAMAGLTLAGCAQPAATPQVIKETVQVPVKETVVVEATKPAVVPTAAPKGPQTIVIMGDREDLTEEQEAQYEAAHEGISIEFLQNDGARLKAMWAAGQPPDIFRTGSQAIGEMILRKQLRNLGPYMDVSTLVRRADLAPANKSLMWDGRSSGQGDPYGIAKDWSPDFSLFINTAAFEEAGVALLPEDKPSTYAHLAEIAPALTKREGDRTLRWGFCSAAMAAWAWTGVVMEMLAQQGQSLYDEGFSKMILAKNADAMAIAKYWYDLAAKRLTTGPLDPAPTWDGGQFTQGNVAIMQYGYWFSASAESDVTKGKVKMIPTPLWAGTTRRSPCISCTCNVMSSPSKVHEASWQYLEWFHAGEPAIERAKTGWGVPALLSQYSLLPNKTPFQQQVQRVLVGEMKAAEHTLTFNPFYNAQSVSWRPHLEKALRGETTFEEMCQNIEKSHNEAIMDGIDRLT